MAAPAFLAQSAQAWTDPNTIATVRRLAHVIQMESAQAVQIAQSQAWSGDYREQEEVSALRNLADSAQYFDSTAEHSWDDLTQTYGDYYRVSQDFQAAQQGLSSLRAYYSIQNLISQISNAVWQLNSIYGIGQGGTYNPYPPQPVPPQPVPTPAPAMNVGVLARELDQVAQSLYSAASQEAVYDHRKQVAVNAALALTQAASQLDSDANAGWGTDLSFDIQQVNNAYNRLRDSVPLSNFSVNVIRPFNEAGQLVNRLNSAGTGGNPGWPQS